MQEAGEQRGQTAQCLDSVQLRLENSPQNKAIPFLMNQATPHKGPVTASSSQNASGQKWKWATLIIKLVKKKKKHFTEPLNIKSFKFLFTDFIFLNWMADYISNPSFSGHPYSKLIVWNWTQSWMFIGNKFMVTKDEGSGEGWIRCLGLADKNYCM